MTGEHHEGVADGIHGSVHWDCGMDSKLAFERNLGGRERHALYVELDGKRYVPAKASDWDTEVLNA